MRDTDITQVSDAVRAQANLQTALEEKVDLEREAAENQAEHVETMEMNEMPGSRRASQRNAADV